MRKILLILLLSLYTCASFAEKFDVAASYQVCFTPQERCTDLIVTVINHAKTQILVQAYSFTSAPIIKALIRAKNRGVAVKIILDRSQFKPQGFSAAKFFKDYNMPLWVDYQANIAHNKVMIIDSRIVITGSFNFTRAAQERNAENVLIINDPLLAKKYTKNWDGRAALSDIVTN